MRAAPARASVAEAVEATVKIAFTGSSSANVQAAVCAGPGVSILPRSSLLPGMGVLPKERDFSDPGQLNVVLRERVRGPAWRHSRAPFRRQTSSRSSARKRRARRRPHVFRSLFHGFRRAALSKKRHVVRVRRTY